MKHRNSSKTGPYLRNFYGHCALRLKTRYRLDLSFEEYQYLNQQFKEGNVFNPCGTHMGDIEAWVKIQGHWVYAYYRVDLGVIGTFMPIAPEAKVVINRLESEIECLRAQLIKNGSHYDNCHSKYTNTSTSTTTGKH